MTFLTLYSFLASKRGDQVVLVVAGGGDEHVGAVDAGLESTEGSSASPMSTSHAELLLDGVRARLVDCSMTTTS